MADSRFTDKWQANIALARALAFLDPCQSGEPIVARLQFNTETGEPLMFIELTADGVEEAVKVLEAAEDPAVLRERLVRQERERNAEAALTCFHAAMAAEITDVFTEIDIREITRDVLDHRQTDMATTIQALDDVFGDIYDPHADDDD